MMRSILITGVALASIQYVRAQDVEETASITTDLPSSITPIDTADWVAGQSSAATSRASVSSILGPFYETVLFAPGLDRGDWVSALASGGENDQTTTWAGYMAEYYTNPAERFAYVNMTIGPTTYMETMTRAEMTISDTQFSDNATTMLGFEITTRCSHTSIAPKISVPDSEWQSGLWNPATMNSDHYFTYRAVCSYEGHSNIRSSLNSSLKENTKTYGMDEPGSGWSLVTVVGESPSAAVASTTSGAAAQTGSGSGYRTEEAKATSTQAAEASEVTAWVNAVVVVAAAAAMAV